MYAPQSSIDPALAALLQTAQMVTPEQTPTVAAQVAQAAQQKMQPQGIMQGMQDAKQDYAAAAPSMMENMKQQQMQQMVKQAMQPQPAGIEGLPAPNMQSMADGGVVGFAGDGEFGSSVPEVVALDELRVAEARRQKVEEEEKLKREFLRSAGIEVPQPQAPPKQILTSQQLEGRVKPQASTSYSSGIDEVLAAARSRNAAQPPAAPAPRPPAAPAAGIAQLVEPTQDRSKVDTAGAEYTAEALKQETALRKIAADKEAAIKGMPDLNEQGIASLRRAEEERRRLLGIEQSDDSRRRWAGIFRGWGGDRDAYDRILGGIANRDSLANQAQLASEQAELKLREAQQAKALGQFDRAKALEQEVAELKNKARDDMLKARQIEASLASNKYATDASIYNTKVGSADKAADRLQQAQLEGARLKQLAEQNNQMKLANLINSANITVSSAIEKMDKDLNKKYEQTLAYKKMLPPDQFAKNPAFVESYQQYIKESEEKYRVAVEPAIRERDRLAAMISSGQDLSKWGEPKIKKGG